MNDELKAQAVSGVKWSGISTGMSTALHFVTLAVLARLLSPSDFGLMGMIMVVIGFAQAFANMGLSNAIIQRHDVAKIHLSSFFWINVLSGLVLFGCIVAIRPMAVIYFKETSLSNYLFFAALIFLITPVGQIFSTLLKKELKFKTLSKIEMAGMCVYSVSSISLALAKLGVLSLIFGQLIRSLFTVSVLLFVFRKTWLPRLHFSIGELRSYFSFGAFQMGARAINYLSANVDYIIIGRFLGPVALGFYALAYQTMTFPLTKINPIITKVAFPVFSKVQKDNAKMREGYSKALNYISMLSFPMLVGMLIVAPEFIKLVYGAKWVPSILILQILCMVGVLKSVGNLVGPVLLAKGRVDIGFYWNIVKVIMVSVAVIVGANWGIIGVAVAILILHIPSFFIMQPIVNRLIDFTLMQYFKAVRSPLICSIIMMIAIIPLRIILGNINMILCFITTVVLGAIIYAGSYYIRDKAVFIELKSILKGN